VCGRYSLAVDPAQLHARFPATEALSADPHYNIAPGAELIAITTDRDGRARAESLRWGLVPFWSKEPGTGLKMINARVETLTERPAYRDAFRQFRCLIPADGFYEWQARAGGPKQPFHITRQDAQLFAFAGLWSVWHRGAQDELRTCTILTRAATGHMAEIHARMPVILEPELESTWLDAGSRQEDLLPLLAGLPDDQIARRAVGSAVNDARYDGPACLDDAPPRDSSATQGSLFA